jgi:hypothetical protein
MRVPYTYQTCMQITLICRTRLKHSCGESEYRSIMQKESSLFFLYPPRDSIRRTDYRALG